MLLGLVEGVWDGGLRAFRLSLLCARRALRQLLFVFEQIFEEEIAPLGGRLCPGDFRTAGDGVGADPGAILALPAEALILDGGTLRLWSDQRWIAGAVGLPEAVATGNQRDRLFVIHRHAKERFADVLGRGDRIGIAVRPFRVDVDEPHLYGAERFRKLAFAAVAFVTQPTAFGAPIELLGLPYVGTAAAETEGLEAHRVERDVAGEDHQIRPGKFPAVFLLDWPQQPARFVQVGVVRPRVQRRETLLASAGPAAAVGDAIGAGTVPCHANEQSTIMSEVCRPPVLRVRHQGMQLLDHGVEVEALELLGVIERRTHWIGQLGVAMENRNVQLVRPPVTVPVSTRERAFASVVVVDFCIHLRTSACLIVESHSSATTAISSNRFTSSLR